MNSPITKASPMNKAFLLAVLLAASSLVFSEETRPDPLAHTEELTPGVFATGFAYRHESANCGWVVLSDHTLLIDPPRGVDVSAFLDAIASRTGRPVKRIVLTRHPAPDAQVMEKLERWGVKVVAFPQDNKPVAIGDATIGVEYRSYGKAAGVDGAAVYLPREKVLFAGPAVTHGPRVRLPGSNTRDWLSVIHDLAALHAGIVVPGYGTWGGEGVLERHARFLTEFRRQVGYGVCMALPLESIRSRVRLPDSDYAWMPYDYPLTEDIDHVYGELTAPHAPFNGSPPDPADARRHALVLIGDRVHEPGHSEDGLRPLFDATRVVPHFAVDFRCLNAENLAKVSLLVIQRDGAIWPDGLDGNHAMWMTDDQQKAVVDFVQRGGAVLNLHNSMGLYPESAYLDLIGGRYTSHGPLERFRVEVIDASHPVTRGVETYFVADEQHTPVANKDVHLLLKSYSDDGVEAAAGWVKEVGRGRVCYLANGHTREALAHPMFRKLMGNSVRWLLEEKPAAE
jgi:type 1 glutamine amidotransferase